jgi:hypothetical protein
MTVSELQTGFLRLAQRLYSQEETTERRRKFKATLKKSARLQRERNLEPLAA